MFEDSEIESIWTSIFSTDKYRLMIGEVADSYPAKKSIFIEFDDVNAQDVIFSAYLLEDPKRCLKLAQRAIMEFIPSFDRPGDQIYVRIEKLPRDAKVEIRNLRAEHLGKLIAVDGLVKKVTTVKPRMTYTLFRCARCNSEIWVPQNGMFKTEPLMCNNPDGGCNKQSTRFIEDLDASKWTDTQRIEIQERPEGLRGGAQPERLMCFVEKDISGIVTPGNSVTLNGILRSAEKRDSDKSTVYELELDVISVEFEQNIYDEIVITPEDEVRILEMSRDPNIFGNIVRSIAPSIFGMEEQKKALALQLFGGCHKVMDDGTSLRGDIHILLIGDPGVAKSQLLRYMSYLAPRGVYASGKSASAAGLTAAAVKDDFGDGRWTLEAGALVLADKGLACIDELDKMSEQDRSSLHEAMEAQRISVAKAGINATLQCRCSMLAAANPKLGRFRTDESIYSQINLPAPLVSRFDLIEVLTDKPDKKRDDQLSTHILDTQMRGELRMVSDDRVVEGLDAEGILAETDFLKPIYSVEELRKYVAYSKRIVPVMTREAKAILKKSYNEIRALSGDDSVAITARQLEGYVRMAEASARMHLSDFVTESDAMNAVELIESYLRKLTGDGQGNYDIDRIAADLSHKDRNAREVIRRIFMEKGQDGLNMEQIISFAADCGLTEEEVRRHVKILYDNGDVFVPSSGMYKLA